MKARDENQPASHCANCKWGMDLDDRCDQMHCINEKSDHAFSNVESTNSCHLFELRTAFSILSEGLI